MTNYTEYLKKLFDDIAFFRYLKNELHQKDLKNELHQLKNELDDLENQVIKLFNLINATKEGYGSVNVVVVGNFSSGKSTFINSILGKSICPMKVNPTTSCITKFVYSDTEEIILLNNGSRKPIDIKKYHNLAQYDFNKENAGEGNYRFEYKYPSNVLRNISLYDTPGFENSSNIRDEKITSDVLMNEADAVLFLLDIAQPVITEKIQSKIEKVKSNKPRMRWYLILNKVDDKSPNDVKKIIDSLREDNFITKTFEDIVGYSSLSVLDYVNKQVQDRNELLDHIWKEICENADLEERNINISIKCDGGIGRRNKCKGNYLINVNGQEITRMKLDSNNNEFLEIRNELIKKIGEIGNEKDKILSYRIKIEKNSYEQRKKNVLNNISNSLKRMIDNMPTTDKASKESIKYGLRSIRKLINNFPNNDQTLLGNIGTHIYPYETKESIFSFLRTRKIQINADKLKSIVIEKVNGNIQDLKMQIDTIRIKDIDKNLYKNILAGIDKLLNKYKKIISNYFSSLLFVYKNEFSSLNNAKEAHVVVLPTIKNSISSKNSLFYATIENLIENITEFYLDKQNILIQKEKDRIQQIKKEVDDFIVNNNLLEENDSTLNNSNPLYEKVSDSEEKIQKADGLNNLHLSESDIEKKLDEIAKKRDEIKQKHEKFESDILLYREKHKIKLNQEIENIEDKIVRNLEKQIKDAKNFEELQSNILWYTENSFYENKNTIKKAMFDFIEEFFSRLDDELKESMLYLNISFGSNIGMSAAEFLTELEQEMNNLENKLDSELNVEKIKEIVDENVGFFKKLFMPGAAKSEAETTIMPKIKGRIRISFNQLKDRLGIALDEIIRIGLEQLRALINLINDEIDNIKASYQNAKNKLNNKVDKTNSGNLTNAEKSGSYFDYLFYD